MKKILFMVLPLLLAAGLVSADDHYWFTVSDTATVVQTSQDLKLRVAGRLYLRDSNDANDIFSYGQSEALFRFYKPIIVDGSPGLLQFNASGQITKLSSFTFASGMAVSSATASEAVHKAFNIVNATGSVHMPELFYNTTGKTFVIEKFSVLISTKSGGSPTVTLRPQKTNAHGFAATNILYGDWSIAAGVRTSTATLSASTIAPGEALRIVVVNSAGMNNDNTKIDVWMREQVQ